MQGDFQGKCPIIRTSIYSGRPQTRLQVSVRQAVTIRSDCDLVAREGFVNNTSLLGDFHGTCAHSTYCKEFRSPYRGRPQARLQVSVRQAVTIRADCTEWLEQGFVNNTSLLGDFEGKCAHSTYVLQGISVN